MINAAQVLDPSVYIPPTALWGRFYLPNHFRAESPAFHWALEDHLNCEGRFAAAVCPRGHAKSTFVGFGDLLKKAAYGQFKYALLISDTLSQACDYLDDIRNEIADNQFLTNDYPGLLPGRIWSRSEIIFANGVRIKAFGVGQKLRGRKHGGTRPDYILMDDIENDEGVESLRRREKLKRWLTGVVIPALDPAGKIRIVGTILHRDSLLSRILRTEGWNARVWRAVSDDNLALWEDWLSYKKLMQLKTLAAETGTLDLWYQEYQGIPRAPEGASFQPTDIRYFRTIGKDENGLPRRFYKSLVVDPAVSESTKSDYTGYTVVYASHDGYWFVVEAFRRKHDPATSIETIKKLHDKHRFDVIGIESVAYQKTLAFWVEKICEEEGVTLPIETITPDQDKRRRILALHPFFRMGRIILRSSLSSRLEEELLNLDDIDHDDIADSLAGHLFVTIAPKAPAMRALEYKDAASAKAAREIARLKRLRKRGMDWEYMKQ
jgi:predicted phage terminase large subunit-like protein